MIYNTLKSFSEFYLGPWPKSFRNIILCLLFNQFLFVPFFMGADQAQNYSAAGHVGFFVVLICLFLFKRKYCVNGEWV